MLTRCRKAFTLLELMVAFIIMAILSAIAVPSLLGVVNGDQLSADSTSASSIVDAAFYNAESDYGQATPAYTFPITAAEADFFVPTGADARIYSIISGDYSDPTPSLQFTFSDGNIVYVAAPQGAGDGSPSTLGGVAPSGATVGAGAGTFVGPSDPTDPTYTVYPGGAAPSGTTTTTAPTTTTSAPFAGPFPTTSCTFTESLTGPLVDGDRIADEGGGGPVSYDTGDAGGYDLSCTGVSNTPYIEGAFSDGAGYWVVSAFDSDYAWSSNTTYVNFDSSFDINQSDITPTDDSNPGAVDEINVYYYATASEAGNALYNFSHGTSRVGDVEAYTADLAEICVTEGLDTGSCTYEVPWQ